VLVFGVRVLISLSSDVLLEYDGKHESGYKSWNIDASNVVAPTASLASSNVASDAFTLTANGSDSDSGVAKYEFYINDVKKYEVASSAGTVSWDVNADSYGSEIIAETTYTCKVRVYDTAGNWKDSSDIQVVTAKAGPTPWDGTVAAGFAGGSGTEADPYRIETAEQLARLAADVNGGNNYWGEYFSLTADIDLGGVQAADGTWSGRQWTPIGDGGYFFGKFNGNGHKISNIYIDNNGNGNGLFGSFSAYGCNFNVKNVVITSGYIRGGDDTGAIVGYTAGATFENCINYATVVGNNNVGGIIGRCGSDGWFTNCSNYGDISGSKYVGGIAGLSTRYGVGGNANSFNGCSNNGTVSGQSNYGDLYGANLLTMEGYF